VRVGWGTCISAQGVHGLWSRSGGRDVSAWVVGKGVVHRLCIRAWA
jgi:hypothetical protein